MNSSEKSKVFLVNSFYKFGMPDPFPEDPNREINGNNDLDEKERMPEKPNDWVYGKSRYFKAFSPSCIYIPTNQVMLKLMRACLGVERPEDLWFACSEQD
jgi:hypothetical protein